MPVADVADGVLKSQLSLDSAAAASAVAFLTSASTAARQNSSSVNKAAAPAAAAASTATAPLSSYINSGSGSVAAGRQRQAPHHWLYSRQCSSSVMTVPERMICSYFK
jgi:hypothetical protein